MSARSDLIRNIIGTIAEAIMSAEEGVPIRFEQARGDRAGHWLEFHVSIGKNAVDSLTRCTLCKDASDVAHEMFLNEMREESDNAVKAKK